MCDSTSKVAAGNFALLLFEGVEVFCKFLYLLLEGFDVEILAHIVWEGA